MKRYISTPLAALAVIAGLASSNAKATSISVDPSPDITVNSGNLLSVSFHATGIPIGETVEIWFVDAVNSTIQDLVEIDMPVRNGANVAAFHIPFSWWPTGRFHIKVVATITDQNNQLIKQVSGIGTGSIRIRSAVIWPYGGASLYRGSGTWVTWTTQSVNNATFFKIAIYNNATGYLQSVGKRVDPSAGRYLLTVPNVVGSGFRITIEGYNLIHYEDGDFEDTVEFTQSEKLNIK